MQVFSLNFRLVFIFLATNRSIEIHKMLLHWRQKKNKKIIKNEKNQCRNIHKYTDTCKRNFGFNARQNFKFIAMRNGKAEAAFKTIYTTATAAAAIATFRIECIWIFSISNSIAADYFNSHFQTYFNIEIICLLCFC